MMSMWPLVTGSKEPGHTALRTGVTPRHRGHPARRRSGIGANVPEHGLAVLLRPLAHQPRRPGGFHATRRALDDEHRSGGQPPVVDQQGEHLLDLRVVQGVRRVGEHHVVRRTRVAGRARARPAGRAPRPCGTRAWSALSWTIRAVRRSDSTEVTTPAPRDIASSPMAPEPAYRSRKRSPVSDPSWASSAENSASRTRSEVGRVASPAGVLRRRPPAVAADDAGHRPSPGTRPARSPRAGGWPPRGRAAGRSGSAARCCVAAARARSMTSSSRSTESSLRLDRRRSARCRARCPRGAARGRSGRARSRRGSRPPRPAAPSRCSPGRRR